MKKIILIITVLAGILIAQTADELEYKWQDTILPKLNKVDRELFDLVWRSGKVIVPDVNVTIRNLIKAGANKNLVINSLGEKVMAYLACHSRSKENAEAVGYLSSIGADSYGIDSSCENGYSYDKPKVFENKHIKLLFFSVNIEGGGKTVLLNKTDEPIYITKATLQVMGHKERIFDLRYEPITVLAGKERSVGNPSWYPIYQFSDDNKEAYYKQFPKIINYKVQKFQRQMSVTYKYKGKEYTFKTPKMTEAWNATFRETVGVL